MLGKIILRSFALLVAALFLSAIHLAAQTQDQTSVADAARRAREQKQAATKPARVIDNDTLNPHSSTPATAPEGASSASAPAQANSPTPPAQDQNVSAGAEAKETAESAEDAEKKKSEIDALKKEIADKQQSIQLQQREIALEQDNYYSNPDHDHDTAGKAKLDSLQSDLQEQQDELAALQAKLADLNPQAEPAASQPTSSAPPASQPGNSPPPASEQQKP